MEEYNSQNSFKTYRLSPHWLQYVINQLPWLIICLCGFLFAGDDTLPYRSYILIASMGLMVYLLYLAIDMKRIEYVITGEQLIYKHGRSMPRLTMTGIRSSSRILEEIRTRVEYNKKRRGIYEITNRF